MLAQSVVFAEQSMRSTVRKFAAGAKLTEKAIRCGRAFIESRGALQYLAGAESQIVSYNLG
jgi:hypothetical protein